jgi:hypothetical protein
MKLKTVLQILITNVSYVLKNEPLHRTLGIHSLPSMNLALDKKWLVVNKHILHEFVYCIDHTYMYVYAILYIQCTSYTCYVVKDNFVISIIYSFESLVVPTYSLGKVEIQWIENYLELREDLKSHCSQLG